MTPVLRASGPKRLKLQYDLLLSNVAFDFNLFRYIVGRSNIVGMPAALMLMKKDCTVTVIHSRTANPERICREVGPCRFTPGSPQVDPGLTPG